MMVTEIMNQAMNRTGRENRQGLRPPARLPALPPRDPLPEDRPDKPRFQEVQGLVPREIPFELPRLVDFDVLDESANEGPKNRRHRPAPKLRLGQMTHRRMDSFDLMDSDSLDSRLRDEFLDGAPYQSHHSFNSRGSTPLCSVQVVGVGLSQSQTSLDQRKDSDAPDGPLPPPPPSSNQNALDRSANVLKRLPPPRRHGEMWGNGPDPPLTKSQGFIFHAERYQWADHIHQHMSPEMFVGTAQERLQAELDYMEGMRQQRRKREVVPHREPINLHMGGKKVMFFERMDIMGEIQRLKHVALPAKARDLYVGRGFRLPKHHALNNPRPLLHPMSADGQPAKFRYKKSKKYIGDYRAVGGPAVTALSAPTELGAGTDHDSLVMVGDSFSQSQKVESDMEWALEPSQKLRTKRYGTPGKRATPNPLKAGLAGDLHQLDEGLDRLRDSFSKMEKDSTGSLMYESIRPHLPEDITECEEKYTKQVYAIACRSSPFGFDELVTMVVMCERIHTLRGDAKAAFDNLEFSTLEKGIIGYVDLFRSIDRIASGNISMSSLREMLSVTISEDLLSTPGGFTHIEEAIGKDSSQEITQGHFLAFVPYFLTLARK